MTEEKTIAQLSADDLEVLLAKKKAEEAMKRMAKQEAYEAIRADVVNRIQKKLDQVKAEVEGLHAFVSEECSAFKEVMAEYGQLKRTEQLSFTIKDGDFKVEAKTSKVKKFDERADIAASRLIEFLSSWIEDKQKGVNDPMYQLAMTLLERNKQGDLDYKSISKLYGMEDKFNSDEYTEIMKLFKESNIVEGTATNYYFHKLSDRGVWLKQEPSFNRM